MKHEPIRHCQRFRRGVEIITENRVPDGLEMNTNLMRASGERRQFDMRAISTPLKDTPAGECRSSLFMINHLSGRVIEILADGQIDLAFIPFHDTDHNGPVGFMNFPLLKLNAELAVGFGVEGENDHPRGVAVQAMNDPGFPVGLPDPGDEAILLLGTYAGHGEQSRGLVDHQQTMVVIEDVAEVGHRQW